MVERPQSEILRRPPKRIIEDGRVVEISGQPLLATSEIQGIHAPQLAGVLFQVMSLQDNPEARIYAKAKLRDRRFTTGLELARQVIGQDISSHQPTFFYRLPDLRSRDDIRVVRNRIKGIESTQTARRIFVVGYYIGMPVAS